MQDERDFGYFCLETRQAGLRNHALDAHQMIKYGKMRILMVCLGNICRSPLAEGIMREKVRESGLDIAVDSAGTAAYHVGEPPDERSQEVAKKHGIDISGQRARQFEVSDFDHFDKIYVMDSQNYENVMSMAQNSTESDKVDLILNEIYPGENRPVPDPYYGGRDGFQRVYDMLEASCNEVIEKARG